MSYYEILRLEYWVKFDRALCEKKIDDYIQGAGTDNIKQNIRRQEAAEMKRVLFNETLRQADLAEWKQELEQRAQLELALLQKAGVKSITKSVFQSMCGLQGSVGLNEQDMRKKLDNAGIQIKDSEAAVSFVSNAKPPQELPTKDLPTQLRNYASMQGMGEIRDIFDFLCIAGSSGKSRKYYFDAVTKEPHKIREEVNSRMVGMGSQNQGQVAAQIYTYIAGMLDPVGGAQEVEKYFNSLRYARIDKLKSIVFKAKTQHPDRQKLLTSAYRSAIADMIQSESAKGVSTEIGGFTREQAVAICDFWMKGMKLPADTELPKMISVSCSCGAVNIFETQEAAKKAKCSACNVNLFTKCVNTRCSTQLPNSAMRCPKCGTDQWSYRAVFRTGGLLALAKSALDKGDFGKTQRLIGRIAALGVTNKDIEELTAECHAKFGEQIKWIAEIDQLIDRYDIDGAEQKIKQFEQKYPTQQTTLNAQKQYILSLNDEIRALRLKAKNASEDAKSAAYMQLYQICKDREAETWLKKLPPAPVADVKCVCNHQSGSCTISWTPTESTPMHQYRVIRKENVPPMNMDDGIMLVQETDDLSCCDTTAEPGRIYYYGVCALRLGAVSKIVCNQSPLHMMKSLNAKDIRCRSMNRKIMLQWKKPEGAAGIKLDRRQGAGPWVCASHCCAESSFIDEGSAAQPLINHAEYTYRVETIYRFGVKERVLAGGELTAKPCPEIQDVRIASIVPKWSGNRFSIRVSLEHAVDQDVIVCRARTDQPSKCPAPGEYHVLSLRALALDVNCGTIPAGMTETEIPWTSGKSCVVPITDIDGGWYYAHQSTGSLDLREPPQMADNRMNPDCLKMYPGNKQMTDLSLLFRYIPLEAKKLYLVINYSADNVIGFVDEVPRDPSQAWAYFAIDLPADKTDFKLNAAIPKKLENGGYYLTAFVEYPDGRISAGGRRKHTQSQKACVKYRFPAFAKMNQVQISFEPGSGTKRLPELCLILAPKGTATAAEARKNALLQFDLPITHDQLNAENTCTYIFDAEILEAVKDPKYKKAEPFVIVKDHEGCVVEKMPRFR